jgi:hypothetical protein
MVAATATNRSGLFSTEYRAPIQTSYALMTVLPKLPKSHERENTRLVLFTSSIPDRSFFQAIRGKGR